MNLELIKKKELTYIILILYLSYGIYIMSTHRKIESSYMIISAFMFFKIVMNYYQCTISYIECKIRNVKKEEGYLFNFLNNFIELRNNKYSIILIIYYIYLNYYYFFVMNYL
jgi:hypothetical protein